MFAQAAGPDRNYPALFLALDDVLETATAPGRVRATMAAVSPWPKLDFHASKRSSSPVRTIRSRL